jgi:serine/threonine protein kinase
VPFTGATPVAIAYSHVRENPTPPRMLNPDVPAPLEAICLKAMAKLPDNRYQTAAEFHDDLERYRNGEPVEASQGTAKAQTSNELLEQARRRLKRGISGEPPSSRRGRL